MRTSLRTLALATIAIGAFLLLAGCFTTTLSLLAPGAATRVDPLYCGDWHFTWKDGDASKSADLVIRNFDGSRYYVEWKEAGEKPTRMNGAIVAVKNATFAQLTDLGDHGDLSNDHLILRVELSGDKLRLRHLDDEFFKDVKTDAALREKIEQNVDNNAMYKETFDGSLVSQP